MSAGNYDFKIEQGTSFRMSLVYKDANGDPIDITNWCASNRQNETNLETD